MKYLACLLMLLVANVVWADNHPKNIIMVVGDGMGPSFTTAYRYFADDKQSAKIDKTVFDRHLVGMASTYPARVDGYVTDSAAGATALSSAIKTYNGAIAKDVDKNDTETVLEWAKQKGKRTGIAVTSQINHATPASYAAHNESRRNYNQIADSYFDDKVNGQFVLDVMLGGGWDYFIRDDRNLVEQFKTAGYQYVDNFADLSKVKTTGKLLGLFADTGMPWALDEEQHTRLPMLAEAAIKQLENDKGFFLLIEASQVDWAGHGNDIASAMAEMHDMANTLEMLEAYVASNPDTLVVVTADHSTGGMSIGANGDYRWDPQWIKQLSASPQKIAEQMVISDVPGDLAERLLGFTLTAEEKSMLNEEKSKEMRAHADNLFAIINGRTNTGWTSGGHTAVDVQIFAMGAQKHLFAGHMDNTEIATKVFQLLGK